MIQTIVHYSLHILFPGVIAWFLFRDQWKRAWLIMTLTMIVDVDHIWACREFIEARGIQGLVHILSCPDLFVADRCSIGFHPLHAYIAIFIYVAMLVIPALRVVAVGLLLHMFTDFQDCLWM